MNAVADPQQWWNATNSNAASAETLTAAGFGVVPKLVIVDATHHGTSISSKDGCVSPFFQALHDRSRVNFWAMPAGRVRSQWESGMSDKFDPFAPEILHGAMFMMAWGLELPMIEKFILIRVLYFTDPNDPLPSLKDFCDVSLSELATDVCASVLDTSLAVSALEQKGLLKVVNAGRMIGGGPVSVDYLWLTPLFDGVKKLSLEQRSAGEPDGGDDA